jgi:hypothetical protein
MKFRSDGRALSRPTTIYAQRGGRMLALLVSRLPPGSSISTQFFDFELPICATRRNPLRTISVAAEELMYPLNDIYCEILCAA